MTVSVEGKSNWAQVEMTGESIWYIAYGPLPMGSGCVVERLGHFRPDYPRTRRAMESFLREFVAGLDEG